MTFDLYFRGNTKEKLNKLKSVSKEQILTAIESLIDVNDTLKFKIVNNGKKIRA